jgi:uncharacterized phage infection (PIP) family protein YhgE
MKEMHMSTPEPENKNQSQADIGAELRELGQQIEQAVRTALESDRAKQVQNDISAGFKEIGAQLNKAIESIKDDPRVQQLAEKGEEAVSKARTSQAAHDFQEALARGIAQLNEQLSAFVNRVRSDAPEGTTPATGETTRLDPDEKP